MNIIKVQLSDPTNHPAAIKVYPNPQMGTWEFAVMVGNFKTEKDARESGLQLAKMMERELGFESGEVQ